MLGSGEILTICLLCLWIAAVKAMVIAGVYFYERRVNNNDPYP